MRAERMLRKRLLSTEIRARADPFSQGSALLLFPTRTDVPASSRRLLQKRAIRLSDTNFLIFDLAVEVAGR